MKRPSKIDSINIRQSRFGLTGIVYSEGYVYAVRFAPNAVVTEVLFGKSGEKIGEVFNLTMIPPTK